MTSSAKPLLNVTGLLREKALNQHRLVLDERNRIEQELMQIDSLRQQSQADEGGLMARRAIGADTLWQGWLSERRARLLQQAAMCRAREADSFASAHRAFARNAALEEIDKDAERKKRQTRIKAEADTIDALVLMTRFSTSGE